MNKILMEVSKLLKENMKKYLPEVNDEELEENGKIYYMNGNNGTSFDFYINSHLSPFMIFYDDEANMGAVKAILDIEGNLDIYFFKNHEEEPCEQISVVVDVNENEILELAVIMNRIADDEEKWGCSIEDMDSDIQVSKEEIDNFISKEEEYEMLKELFKTCIVTKNILEEDWKVGLMQKLEPNSETDSGWFLSAGNESQEYIDDPENLCVITLAEITDRDASIIPYLMEKNEGDVLIRISDDEFEFDDGEKEIFISKFE